MILDELIEPTAVLIWWDAGDQVFRSALQCPFQKGLTLFVEVPLLQKVDDGDVVDLSSVFRLNLMPASVLE